MKIGLLTIATNKYIRFVDPLWESAKKHFLTNHDVTMFLFTDSVDYKPDSKQVIIPQQHLVWPGPTLFRYNVFDLNKDKLKEMDYLFYCDADMLFVNTVGDEVLGERVATNHPGFFQSARQTFTYETNPRSLAFVPQNKGTYYFAGGFNGGTSKEYLKMAEKLSENISEDYSKGIVAVWHDESHMNKYFIDNPPTVILSPSYCYPESWTLDAKIEKRLLALDKNHKEMREK